MILASSSCPTFFFNNLMNNWLVFIKLGSIMSALDFLVDRGDIITVAFISV